MEGRSIAGVLAIALGAPLGVVGAVFLPSNLDEPHSYVLILAGLALIAAGIFLLRSDQRAA
jgi:cytochrome c biogenesis protein CcdA